MLGWGEGGHFFSKKNNLLRKKTERIYTYISILKHGIFKFN